MKKIVRRLKSKTPLFFKKVVRVCGVAAAFGFSALMLPDEVISNVPHLKTIASYMIASGLVGAFIAQLAQINET